MFALSPGLRPSRLKHVHGSASHKGFLSFAIPVSLVSAGFSVISILQKLRSQLAKRVLGESSDKIRPTILLDSKSLHEVPHPTNSTSGACTLSESRPNLHASHRRKPSSLAAKLGSSISSPEMLKLPALAAETAVSSIYNGEQPGAGHRRRRRRETVLQSLQSDQGDPSRALHAGAAASNTKDMQSQRRWGGPHPTTRQQQEQYTACLQRQYGVGSDRYVQWRIKNKIPSWARVFCMAGEVDQI
jgi:hypothetical protein